MKRVQEHRHGLRVQYRAQVESDDRTDESQLSKLKLDGAEVEAVSYFMDSTRVPSRWSILFFTTAPSIDFGTLYLNLRADFFLIHFLIYFLISICGYIKNTLTTFFFEESVHPVTLSRQASLEIWCCKMASN